MSVIEPIKTATNSSLTYKKLIFRDYRPPSSNPCSPMGYPGGWSLCDYLPLQRFIYPLLASSHLHILLLVSVDTELAFNSQQSTEQYYQQRSSTTLDTSTSPHTRQIYIQPQVCRRNTIRQGPLSARTNDAERYHHRRHARHARHAQHRQSPQFWTTFPLKSSSGLSRK